MRVGNSWIDVMRDELFDLDLKYAFYRVAIDVWDKALSILTWILGISTAHCVARKLVQMNASYSPLPSAWRPLGHGKIANRSKLRAIKRRPRPKLVRV